jgi:hypothetical protein
MRFSWNPGKVEEVDVMLLETNGSKVSKRAETPSRRVTSPVELKLFYEAHKDFNRSRHATCLSHLLVDVALIDFHQNSPISISRHFNSR